MPTDIRIVLFVTYIVQIMMLHEYNRNIALIWVNLRFLCKFSAKILLVSL